MCIAYDQPPFACRPSPPPPCPPTETQIDARLAPAEETLQRLLDAEGAAGTFDFAFIDADKRAYGRYFELCLRLVRRGGLIAVDNVLWYGKVADDEVRSRGPVLFWKRGKGGGGGMQRVEGVMEGSCFSRRLLPPSSRLWLRSAGRQLARPHSTLLPSPAIYILHTCVYDLPPTNAGAGQGDRRAARVQRGTAARRARDGEHRAGRRRHGTVPRALM